MGLSARIPSGVEGRDYSEIMLGKGGKRPNSALYIRCSGPRGGARGVRTHRYTFAVTPKQEGGTETLLFDNKQDPYQLKNVAASRPEVVRRLSDELKKWLDRTDDPWKV
jgi:hypothetical protein